MNNSKPSKEIKVENSEKVKKERKSSPVYFSIKEKDGRKIYKTYLFKSIAEARVNKNDSDKFFISFAGFRKNKVTHINLFKQQKEGHKFEGIYYREKIPLNPLVSKYTGDSLEKFYYLEFRFTYGSVVLVLKEIYDILTNKEIENYREIKEKIIKLEEDVYKFYSKELSSPFCSFLEEYYKNK